MNQTTSFIKDFIRHLLSATANAVLYGMEHPQVVSLASQAYNSLIKALELRQEFTLVAIENELVIDGQPQEFSLFLNRFVQIISLRGIGHIRLIQGVDRTEILAFIAALAQQTSESRHAINSSAHVRLGWIELRSAEGNDPHDPDSALRTSDNSFSTSGNQSSGSSNEPLAISDIPAAEIERFREIYETVRLRHKLKINGIVEIVSSFVDAYKQEGQSLLVMAALRETDEYTFNHSTNVSILNIAQASYLGIDGPLLNDIGVAGMLHDIGKIFIPEEILTKTSSLTSQEHEIIQTHPIKGSRYLLDSPGVPRLAVINAFEHHLKYDLSGYPAVPRNWQQNICSQITTISDIFDALRTRRSYREPLELNTIMDMMKGLAGTDLHPILTNNFITILSRLSNC